MGFDTPQGIFSLIQENSPPCVETAITLHRSDDDAPFFTLSHQSTP